MWPNPQFPTYLVTYTEEIFNEKLHFSCSERHKDNIYGHCSVIFIVDFAQVFAHCGNTKIKCSRMFKPKNVQEKCRA